MRIWRLGVDADHVAWLRSIPMRSHEECLQFDGRSQLANWKILSLEQIDDDSDVSLADVVCSDACFLVSERAKSVIDKITSDKVEFLPYDFQGIPYYLINPMELIPCLDKEQSKLLMSSTIKDKILIIEQYCLIESFIEGHQLFRMKECPLKGPFVTDEIVNGIREAKLSGFCFELIWDGHKQKEGTKILLEGVIKEEY